MEGDKPLSIKNAEEIQDLKIRMSVAENHIKDVRDDVTTIKNNTQWILRMIIGGIVMELLYLVMHDPNLIKF
jgi:plasmid maintenance system killer protein